jgi:hypothetical protein
LEVMEVKFIHESLNLSHIDILITLNFIIRTINLIKEYYE